MESKSSNNGRLGELEKEVRVANKRGIGTCESLLRLLALALALSAAVTLGVDKQTKIVPMKIVDTLPAINVPVSAKWHYLSAFLYVLLISFFSL